MKIHSKFHAFSCMLVLGFLLGSLPQARAEFSDIESVAPYSPQLAGGDKPLPLKACDVAEPLPNISLGGRFRCGSVMIDAGAPEVKDRMGQYRILLTLDARKRFQISVKGDDFGFLDSVHSIDLNEDGKADYILEFAFHGVGMASSQRVMVFLFSGAEGFAWQAIQDIRAPASRHFYRDFEGKTIFLTSRRDVESVTKMPPTTDKKRHSFWVFEPLVFSKGNGLWGHIPSANYPLWVQYKNEPHSQPTQLISVATQKRVTRSPLSSTRGGKMQPLG